MSILDQVWPQIERSFLAGRLAHAWVIVGDPGGNAKIMANRMASMVLSENQEPERKARTMQLAEQGLHPDQMFLEPGSKSRRITTDDIRMLNIQLHQSTYEGGWKVATLYHADRLMTNAANAFLKTLEEPPQRTLILLLTDSPQSMLNTVVSRCQRLILSEALANQSDSMWREKLIPLLEQGWPSCMEDAFHRAAAVRDLLAAETKRIEKEQKHSGAESEERDVEKAQLESRLASQINHIRTDLLESMLQWYRDVWVRGWEGEDAVLNYPREIDQLDRESTRLGTDGAEACLQRLWELQDMLERNLPVYTAVLTAMRPIQQSMS